MARALLERGVLAIFREGSRAVPAVDRQQAERATDEGARPPQFVGTRLKVNVGFGFIVHQSGGGLFAQAEAGTSLNGQRPVTGSLIRFNPVMRAKMVKESIRIFERADLICTDADNFPFNRFVIKEGIKLDDAVDVRQRNTQQPRHFRRDLLRKPVVNFLRGMEGW
jgi:hypothetical protein